ncbi:MalY/PatB family protein [Geosporobacter ferrireducens]|uniref:cysteine-S-conjugate beta-lyase n=1 Tax=Geosporobacter ferrireducens TaxID=1424294 RepID=A0A1D8GHE8_9FIRM|nr:MalY/PatB family protein [Geosporobacter ferrireducens]AOT70332.1 cystathionine beta-lyase [Geosporobacter ferrireducens]MTI54301.1 pyridoxal phosphate-dependent aminotransferase [Geosporobacter ferrireducens]
MKYDFDTVIDRSNNFAAKYDELEVKFGRRDLLPLWVADMDFKAAKPIVDAIQDRAAQEIYGYTARPDSYFEAVMDWYKRRYGWEIKREWICHSPAVVTSMSIMMREFTKPGDKIIIQTPVYYPFFSVVQDNDRELICNPLKRVGEKYVMDYEDLERKIDDGVKYLILCNPHNPVGRVWTKEELIKLGNLCIKNNIKVIADEIHGDLVLGGKRYTPFASISEEFAKHSITCVAATKTFNIAGLQASTVIFPDKKDYDKFEKVLNILDIKRNNCFSLVAVEAAYREGEEWLTQLIAYLEENIQFVTDYCRTNIPQIKPNKPEGTYLLWLDCKELGLNNEELQDLMVNEAKVALNSGIGFGKEGSGYMRINVACPRALLQEGLNRMEKAIRGKFLE